MNLAGKRKRMGKFSGWKSDWKKAIVTLERRGPDRILRRGLSAGTGEVFHWHSD